MDDEKSITRAGSDVLYLKTKTSRPHGQIRCGILSGDLLGSPVVQAS